MKTNRMAMVSVTALGVMGAAYLASAAMAQDEKPPIEMPPMLTAEQVKTIWPASLQKIAGRYVFSQVASPGGLWERLDTPKGPSKSRQVSLNEVPAAFRQRLTGAEIVISDLELPTLIEADQRESPSKRGMLRFYNEETLAKVSIKNLPGMAGRDGDSGNFSGRVLLRLQHQSHSNPSVTGVLQQRLQTEATWGAATLDFADLTASTLPPPPKEGAEAEAPAKGTAVSGKKTPAARPDAKVAEKGKSGAPRASGKDDPDHDDHEGEIVIGNARVLRGGIEIFAFVEWEAKTPAGTQRIHGSVRLLKSDVVAPPSNPPAKITRSETE